MLPEVKLVGWYGGDKTHAEAAWTSTNVQGREERIPALLKALREGSDGNPHATPFERSLLHFNLLVDTATHIHVLKHRTIATNGESARYKEHREDRIYIPPDWGGYWAGRLQTFSEEAFTHYHNAVEELQGTLGRNRAKESARFFLPYASMIHLDVSMTFRAFTAFQALRNAPHAQAEVRFIASEMLRLVKTDTNDDFKYSLEAWNLT
jgi:flavin-dependent thymidylate synthase